MSVRDEDLMTNAVLTKLCRDHACRNMTFRYADEVRRLALGLPDAVRSYLACAERIGRREPDDRCLLAIFPGMPPRKLSRQCPSWRPRAVVNRLQAKGGKRP